MALWVVVECNTQGGGGQRVEDSLLQPSGVAVRFVSPDARLEFSPRCCGERGRSNLETLPASVALGLGFPRGTPSANRV
jgi:hypothetical protein